MVLDVTQVMESRVPTRTQLVILSRSHATAISKWRPPPPSVIE